MHFNGIIQKSKDLNGVSIHKIQWNSKSNFFLNRIQNYIV